jgi:hypothetical protein
MLLFCRVIGCQRRESLNDWVVRVGDIGVVSQGVRVCAFSIAWSGWGIGLRGEGTTEVGPEGVEEGGRVQALGKALVVGPDD